MSAIISTAQILSAAYAAVFGIPVKPYGYHGQVVGDTVIDYAYFDVRSVDFDIDNDWFEAIVEDGSEGSWIGVHLRTGSRDSSPKCRHVGVIKTLARSRGVWREMGALAGELAFVANNVVVPQMCYNANG